MFDLRLNSHGRLNLIQALLQAIDAGADEAFVTGTLGGVTPVTRIDGRMIRTGAPGEWTRRISGWYADTVMA